MSNRLMHQMAIATLALADGSLGAQIAKAKARDEADQAFAEGNDRRKAADMAPREHKPSGSKPVPGGGARERERRLARLAAKQS